MEAIDAACTLKLQKNFDDNEEIEEFLIAVSDSVCKLGLWCLELYQNPTLLSLTSDE